MLFFCHARTPRGGASWSHCELNSCPKRCGYISGAKFCWLCCISATCASVFGSHFIELIWLKLILRKNNLCLVVYLKVFLIENKKFSLFSKSILEVRIDFYHLKSNNIRKLINQFWESKSILNPSNVDPNMLVVFNGCGKPVERIGSFHAYQWNEISR